MKTLAVLLALLLLPSIAYARKCPPKHVCGIGSYSLRDALLKGFELQAGFRWQTEEECNVCVTPRPSGRPENGITVKDPFFIGAGARLPLGPKGGAFYNFDRDWTEAPHWQSRVGIYINPFK